jgi:hypothetical protein
MNNYFKSVISATAVLLALTACNNESTSDTANATASNTASASTAEKDINNGNRHTDLSLADKVTYGRALETAIWAMPLMNMEAMRQAYRDAGVQNNDIAYFSPLQNWQYQIATPNNTTPYVMAFYDLSDGPLVIDIPSETEDTKLFGTMMDAWQRPIEDVGGAGFDKGKGGKYLLLPPNHDGEIPTDYFSYEHSTNLGYILLRPIIQDNSESNLLIAEKFTKQINIYPLAEAVSPTANNYVNVSGMSELENAISVFDETYYQRLHSILQEELVAEADLSMMGMLKSIGIEIGKPYATTEAQKTIFASAALDARDYMLEQYHDALIAPFYEGKSWTSILTPGTVESGFSFKFPTYLDYNNRGALYYAVCTSVKTFGAATFYLGDAKDNTGEWLDGGKTYKMNVPANVPAKNFWSVMAYNLESAAWIKNVLKVGVASSDKGLEVNEDGSIDIYFGPEAPEGKEANWTPTKAGERFFLLFRFYGPEKSAMDKTYQLNDLVEIK